MSTKLTSGMTRDELQTFINEKEQALTTAKALLANYDKQFDPVDIVGLRYDAETMEQIILVRDPVSLAEYFIPAFNTLRGVRLALGARV